MSYPDHTPRSNSNDVSVGLLTKTGLGMTLLMLVGALVDMVLGDSFDNDTRLLITAAVASAIATVLARAYQAGKLYAAQHFNNGGDFTTSGRKN